MFNKHGMKTRDKYPSYRYRIILYSSILILLSSITLHADGASTDESLEKAISELQAGRPFASLNFATKAVDADPRSAMALAVLGLSQLDCGEWEKAGKQLKKARAIDPQLPEIFLGLGKIAAGKTRCDEAISHLRKAVNSKYFKAEAYIALAACFEDKNLHRKATEAMREAAKYMQQFSEIHQKNILNYGQIFSAHTGRTLYKISKSFKSTSIHFTYSNGVFGVPVSANGHRLGRLFIDTGNNGFLIINKKLVKELNLAPTGKIIARSLAGEHFFKSSLLENLVIGELEVRNVPVLIGANTPFNVAGIIGWKLLKNFNISIDFKNFKLYFFNQAYPELQRKIFNKNSTTVCFPFLYLQKMWVTARFGEDFQRAYFFDTGAWPCLLDKKSFNRTITIPKKPPYSFGMGGHAFQTSSIRFIDFSDLYRMGRIYFYGVIGMSLFRDIVVHINPKESMIMVELGKQ